MKKISILSAIAFVAAILCSCSDLSKSKALDIINETEGNIPAQFTRIMTGTYWIPGEKYVNLGGGSVCKKRDDADNSHHEIDMAQGKNGSVTPATTSPIEGKSYRVFFNGFNFGGSTGKCDGCAECLEKYNKAGLIKLEILDDGSQYETGNKMVNVELTDLGAKYKLLPADESMATEMTYNSLEYFELAHKVYTDVKELKVEEKTASAMVEYYVEFTPFGTALGYTTDSNRLKTDIILFDKSEQGWEMVPWTDERYNK